MGIIVTDDISGKFHNGKLHAEAESQEGDIVVHGHSVIAVILPSIPRSAKAAGNQDAVCITEKFLSAFSSCYQLRNPPT